MSSFAPAREPGRGRRSGARARQAGRSFEAAIDAVNRWYDERGEALIEKVNPPTFGWGESLGVGLSTVDYIGTWSRDEYIGRDGIRRNWERVGVAFDAKSVTGKTRIGFEEIQKGRGTPEAMKERARFLRQVDYLRGLRDRHKYAAFLLLYCADLDTLWLCDRLDELALRRSIEIRTIHGRGASRTIEHHLPYLTNPGNPISLLGIAAVPRIETKRPFLDYLGLLTQAR